MSDVVRQAVRHARWRWIGAPLLLSGVGLLGIALYRGAFGGSLWTVALSAFGTGLALASFGANHDAAMSLAFKGREENLPRALKDELSEELEKDRDALIALRPAPRVAMAIPWVALFIQVLVANRLFGLVT